MTDQEELARGVALLPELKRRYEGRSVMNLTGSILLDYEEAPTLIAAIEAAERIAKPASNGEAVVERVAIVIETKLRQHDVKWLTLDIRELARAALAAIKPAEKES